MFILAVAGIPCNFPAFADDGCIVEKENVILNRFGEAEVCFDACCTIDSVTVEIYENKDSRTESVLLYAAYNGGLYNHIYTAYNDSSSDAGKCKLELSGFAQFSADKIKIAVETSDSKVTMIKSVKVYGKNDSPEAERLEYKYSWTEEQPFSTDRKTILSDSENKILNDGDENTFVQTEKGYSCAVMDMGGIYNVRKIIAKCDSTFGRVDGFEIKYSLNGEKYFEGGFYPCNNQRPVEKETATDIIGKSGVNARYIKLIAHTRQNGRICEAELWGTAAESQNYIRLNIKQQNYVAAFIDWSTYKNKGVSAYKLYISDQKINSVNKLKPKKVFEKDSKEYESKYCVYSPLEPERTYYIAVTCIDEKGNENQRPVSLKIKTPKVLGEKPKDIFCINYYAHGGGSTIKGGEYNSEFINETHRLMDEMGTIQKNRTWEREYGEYSKRTDIGFSYMMENMYGVSGVKTDNSYGMWTYGVGNEPDYHSSAEWGSEYIIPYYKAIKAADARNIVTAPALGSPDKAGEAWLDKLYTGDGHDGKLIRENYDVFDFHPYIRKNYAVPEGLENGVPEGLFEVNKRFRNLLKKYGDDKPFVISEIGWATCDNVFWMNPVSYEKQRDYITRMYLVGIADDIKEIYLYNMKDDGPDSSGSFEHSWGLLDWWCVPKPSYYGYYILSNIMQEAEYLGTMNEMTNPYYGLDFYDRSKSLNMSAVWNASNKTDNAVFKVLSEDSEVDIISADGNYEKAVVNDGLVNTTISGTPKFIYSKSGIKLVSTAPVFKPENDTVSTFRGRTAEINLVTHRGSEGIDGRISAKLPSGWNMVSDTEFNGDEKNKKIVFSVPEDAEEKDYDIPVSIVDEKENVYTCNVTVRVKRMIDVSLSYEPAQQGSFDKWNVWVELKNNSNEDLSGKVVLSDSKGLDWEQHGSKDFGTIKADESIRVCYRLNSAPRTLGSEAGFTVHYNGYTSEFKQNMNFSSCVNDGKTPVIDGEISEGEWSAAQVVKPNDGAESNMLDWKGNDDCSFVCMRKWDSENLYIAVDATDDIHNQEDSGAAIWKGDGIQIAIDTDRRYGKGSATYHEFGAALDNNGIVRTWRWTSPLVVKSDMPLDTAKSAISRKGNHTVYEIAIPWSDLMLMQYEPNEGEIFGFSMLLNDNDGKVRKGFLEYMSGIGNSKNTNAFEDMILIKQK